jgi:glutaredoxin
MPTSSHVTLYSRHECHLCDEMKAELERRGYRVTVVDIDGDRELKRKYGWDIPVAVLDDGTVLAKHRL